MGFKLQWQHQRVGMPGRDTQISRFTFCSGTWNRLPTLPADIQEPGWRDWDNAQSSTAVILGPDGLADHKVGASGLHGRCIFATKNIGQDLDLVFLDLRVARCAQSASRHPCQFLNFKLKWSQGGGHSAQHMQPRQIALETYSLPCRYISKAGAAEVKGPKCIFASDSRERPQAKG